MLKKTFLITLALSLLNATAFADDAGLHYPHYEINNIGCLSCHYQVTDSLPDWLTHEPQDIDDTPYNNLCRSCHNDVIAPNVNPHSSLTTSSQYHQDEGGWAIECRECHWPHHQFQVVAYGSDSYLYSGVSTDVTTTTLTETGAGWSDDQYNNKILVPNVNQPSYNYLITDTTSDTLTVEISGSHPEPIDLIKTSVGDTFAIIYGNLIRSTIPTPYSGYKEVRFFNNNGTNSFADGDSTRDGVCEVCHTEANHFRNTGEINAGAGGYDHTAVAGTNCITCHPHTSGFAHGNGTGSGDCWECHGHDEGYGGATGGKGSFKAHSTHTESDSDDLKGPNINCDECHDTSNFPYFKSGTDSNADGRITLDETDVCNTCHSPNGTYDGINDATVGAKNNWHSAVYEADSLTLQAGKEKWCATCHDENPSVIQGVAAPNIIGDEDGSYTYGTGWGFYKTGHGLDSGEYFPSSGNLVLGAGKKCGDCHDYSLAHIDGEPRTYDDGDAKGLDPSFYRQGYRLQMVGGEEPLMIPKTTNSGNTADHYRLCFQAGCHIDSGPFTDSGNMDTNMVTEEINRHAYHLNFNNDGMFASDWSGTRNSRMTCVACHNVHGSTQLAMVRDGKLIDKEPGQQIWYKNDAITYIKSISSNPPIPEDLPLSASDGKAWISASSGNLCAHCHPTNGFTGSNDRDPFQDVNQSPVLEWAGTSGLTDDGVAPDSGASNTIFTFRVAFSDINNDSPSSIEVWVDLDDDSTYDAGEKLTMNEADFMDTNLIDGKIFTKELAIAKAGDGVLNYRFYANDGVLDASGAPTGEKSLTVLNNPPTLLWTGEDNYVDDGVNPDVGGDDNDFEFRVLYIDADNDAPVSIRVLIDHNDDGDYLDSGEVQSLTKVGSTSDYVNGEIYTTTLSLDHDLSIGDTIHNYKFQANDGTDDAVGASTSDSTVTVLVEANNPPNLEWMSGACIAEGVKPAYGAKDTDFEFMVTYTDVDPGDGCPASDSSNIQVWIDEDNDGYESDEKHNLIEDDAGDTDCTDGKVYKLTRQLSTVGTFNYRFYGFDGTETAFGEASSNSEVAVIDARAVRVGYGDTGPRWYNNIQDAIDAVNGEQTVLVYEGTYNETIELNSSANSDTTIRSVCGPDLTVINGTGDGTTVTFNRNGRRNVLDGFQVTGGETGISVLGTEATINNCQVHDNSRIDSSIAAGIYVGQNGTLPTLTLTNSEIYNNTSDRGAGVRIWRGTGHSIDNTIIRNNTTTGDSMADGGGGVHIFQVNQATISNSIISDNESINYSGGGLYVSQVPDDYSLDEGLTIEDSIIRNNTTNKNGGGVYSDLSKIYFVRTTITGNTAEDDGPFPYVGGGAYSQPSYVNYASFVNCIVADNQSKQGGMAYLNGGDLDIINSTIANNQATLVTGGAIYSNPNTDPSVINIHNSILWGNQAITHGHIGSFSNGPVTITDSVIQSGDDGDFVNAPYFIGSEIPTVSGFASEDDPWFVGDGNYHIGAFSPAVDTADATYAPTDDFDGNARPAGAGDDIGADEYVDPEEGLLFTYAYQANAEPYSNTAIAVSMPYRGDDNSNNTYTIEYKLSSSSTWLYWGANPKGHTASPYVETITGLVDGETWDVRLTYNDTDGVYGSPVQFFTVELPTEVSFTSSHTSVTEDGPITITAALNHISDQDVTVPFSVNASSTATGGGIDYSITSSPITITAGNTTADITVTIIDDSLLEASENVIVDMGTPTNASQGTTTTHTVTILDGVAYWSLDETSGTTAADSIGSNDGTVINATWTSSGMFDNALSFDGDDYMEVPDSESLDITEELTIELWFQPSVTYDATLANYVVLVDRQWSAVTDSYFLGINGDGKLHLGSYGGNIQSTQSSWDAGTGYHVVGTYRNVGGAYSGELYINGVAETLSASSLDAMAGGSQKIGIGGSDRFIKFNGTIDEVVIYNRTLTSSEVQDRYSGGTGGLTSLTANDNSSGGTGIQAGDQVVIQFNTATNAPAIDADNIDTVLALNNGHSWLDGSGSIDNAVWSSTTDTDDTLTITLSDTTSEPTIVEGDTVTLDGTTIENSGGFAIIDSSTIGGSFGEDVSPTVTFTSSSQSTADESGTATITVELSASSGSDVTIPFTVNGASTATGGGTDYSITASPVTITAGNTSVDITVTIATDSDVEGDETVVVDMGSPTNATQGATTTHMLTITDDDAAPLPTVSFTASSQSTADESGTATITVELSAVSGSDVTIPFTINGSSTADGGATDYSITASPVTITAGNTSVDITVTVTTDSDVEGDETVIIDMGSPTNASQGATTTHTLTITDDDSASGATYTVCPAGHADAPCDYETINAGIDDAGVVDGDTLLVSADTYSENINFDGKDITIQSAGGAASTIIEGDGSNAPVVAFGSAETASAVLDGFTINNQNDSGANHGNGGIKITASATPTIKNSILKGNDLSAWSADGAGIYISGGGVTVESCTIGVSGTPNIARYGAGIYAINSILDVTITGSTITYNQGVNAGGGIYMSNMTGTNSITNTSLSNNDVSNDAGGGIYMMNMATANTTISGCTIDDNTASKGAGILSSGSPFTMSNTSVNNNIASNEGGGIRLDGDGADAVITGGSVNGNSASHGAGFYLLNGSDLTYTNGSISGNIGVGASLGGGIYDGHAGTELILTKMYIQGNKSVQHGGGIKLAADSTATITNSIITGNAAGSGTWEDGGGICSNGTLNVYSSTIAGNYAGQGGGIHMAAGTAVVTNSIIWDNTAGDGTSHQIYGSPAVTYSDVEGSYSGTGNVNDDPFFTTPAQAGAGTPTQSGLFTLEAGSGVIDVGGGVDDIEPDPPTDDIEGNSRPQESGYDMGAAEYAAP
ncbi:MAG: hypothetical protein KQH63_03365 [Desulfobulbaceae bacterium]|nr:hypothetical protein [Desulfobulbaceae bacterium]